MKLFLEATFPFLFDCPMLPYPPSPPSIFPTGYRSRITFHSTGSAMTVGACVVTLFAFLAGTGTSVCAQEKAAATLPKKGSAAAQEKSEAAKKPPTKLETPAARGLDANLYMQISAEYRAVCLQSYHWAKRLVNEKMVTRIAATQRVARFQSTASSEAIPTVKPPAVILDLDETVLDNRAFQTKQIREGWAYSQEYWSRFEQEGGPDVIAIPGAIEFIRHLKTLGIQPVYITNRNVTAHEPTMEILKRLQIDVPEDLLLCADVETKSNKDSRRAKVRERFDVLLLVGDNLRDFDDIFKYDGSHGPAKGVDDRMATVEAHRHRFGVDWVLLPNPAYGEWNKALGNGKADANLLEPRLP